MLSIISIPPTINGTPQAMESPAEVSVINNLKAVRKIPAKGRAQLAAHWTNGEYDIKRTVANAAVIFAVNQPYVCAARNGGKQTSRVDQLVRAWDRASPAELEELFRVRSPAVWRMFESVTATTLETAPMEMNGAANHSV